MKLKVNYKKLLIICLSCTLTFSSIGCSSKKTELEPIKQEQEKIIEETTKTENNIEKVEKTQKGEPNTKITNEKVESIPNIETKEVDVINYFEELEKDIYDNLVKKDDSVLNRITEKCAHFILFMSNEEEIKGYTWSELSNEAKEKIVSIFLRVDEKVTLKYPNYVEKIKDYSKKTSEFISDAYTTIKDKTNAYIDEVIDEDKQEEIKESFKEGSEDLKDSINNTKEKIKKWARDKKS